MTFDNKGIIRIDFEFVRKQPERVAEVFALMKFVPLKAEALYMYDVIEYHGLSAAFPEVKEGKRIPLYDIKITRSEAGNIERVEAVPEK